MTPEINLLSQDINSAIAEINRTLRELRERDIEITLSDMEYRAPKKEESVAGNTCIYYFPLILNAMASPKQ